MVQQCQDKVLVIHLTFPSWWNHGPCSSSHSIHISGSREVVKEKESRGSISAEKTKFSLKSLADTCLHLMGQDCVRRLCKLQRTLVILIGIIILAGHIAAPNKTEILLERKGYWILSRLLRVTTNWNDSDLLKFIQYTAVREKRDNITVCKMKIKTSNYIFVLMWVSVCICMKTVYPSPAFHCNLGKKITREKYKRIAYKISKLVISE